MDANPPIAARRRRKEARPGEIIEAATVEFAEKGYAATKLSRVAQRAGVSHGTIYHYFDGKEALFEAVVRASLIDVLDGLTPATDASEGRYEALLRAALIEPAQRLRGSLALGLVRTLLVEGHRFPELMREVHDAVFVRGERYLKNIIEAGIASGEFRDGPHHARPILLLAPSILSALLEPLASDRDNDDQEAGETAAFVAALMDGIRR